MKITVARIYLQSVFANILIVRMKEEMHLLAGVSEPSAIIAAHRARANY